MVEPGSRQRQIEAALSAFRNSSWGLRTSTQEGAAGLCKRSSLVLLVQLERQGIDDAQLWHLGHPREWSDFAPSDEHYMVALDGEAIDPLIRAELHGIPPNWRELADVEPPGTSIGWEYRDG
jgi:hypothetical protein